MGRAVIAVRVSPRPAENVRYSPGLQEEQCRAWCTSNGYEVVGVISDIQVSGGSRHRFDSILDAIDRLKPDAFVVADLSRWTRDTPTRYFAMKAILEDAGIKLVSVHESFVGSDMPFSDTITTAVVEGNYQQRLVANRKTSEGVRKAWAAGKRFGPCLGWTWDPATRSWSYDSDLIRSFYNDWLANVPLTEMARRYGIGAQNVTKAVQAKRQVDVVGYELWHRANQAQRASKVRNDAKYGNVWRGMLICPFCGRVLVQDGVTWGTYRCPRVWDRNHGWRTLSARKYVLPSVVDTLTLVEPPQSAYEGETRKPVAPQRMADPSMELSRLSEAWAKGRLTTERYERAVAEVESRVVLPPPPPDPEVVADLHAIIPFLDCYRVCHHEAGRCPRDVEAAGLLNRLLRELLEPIAVGQEREVAVRVREQYLPWVSP
jgi:DNA invertase Pin-like site-specific DNA recombinase